MARACGDPVVRLDTATIANLARGAGFVHDDLHCATALALVSSGGQTHYQHAYGAPGCGDLRGLWALDVDRFPTWAGVDLYDPQQAARAAYELTSELGGFSWSAAWRAGAHVRHVPMAATEATRWTYTQPAPALAEVGPTFRHIDAVLATMRHTITGR